jgi:hypothetical protein
MHERLLAAMGANLLPSISRGGGPAELVEGASSQSREEAPPSGLRLPPPLGIEGRRSRWRPSAALLENERDHTFEIVAHVYCCDSQCSDALRIQPLIPPPIPLRIGSQLVGEAVDFDAKCRFVTKEVERVRTERMLTAELEAIGPAAKVRNSMGTTKTEQLDHSRKKWPLHRLRRSPSPANAGEDKAQSSSSS